MAVCWSIPFQYLPMSDIPANEVKILIAASGGRCAFPKCGKLLVTESPHGADPVFSGEACHIIAQSRQGPRGKSELNEEQRNRSTNLILLCPDHHTLIEKRPLIYSVRVLLAMKAAHEATHSKGRSGHFLIKRDRERVQSTCMAVTQFPGQIFYAASRYKPGEEAKVREKRNFENYRGLTPFFLADDCLYSFCDLRQPFNPFRDIIEPNKAKFQSVGDLLKTQEGHNRSLPPEDSRFSLFRRPGFCWGSQGRPNRTVQWPIRKTFANFNKRAPSYVIRLSGKETKCLKREAENRLNLGRKKAQRLAGSIGLITLSSKCIT